MIGKTERFDSFSLSARTNKMNAAKPIIAVTMGDPVGIGPEVLVKALAIPDLWEVCRPVVFGDLSILVRAAKVTGTDLVFAEIRHPAEVNAYERALCVLSLSRLGKEEAGSYGKPTRETGKAMVSYILQAIRLAMEGHVHAVVTGPINKAAMSLAGYSFPGHTELLAHQTGTKDYAMMLAGDRLRVVLVTIHCALKDVSALLSVEKVITTVRLTHQALEADYGIHNPAVAVAALNPHAGETGMFGDEETTIIKPAIECVRKEGIDAVGPLPADSLFYYAAQGTYDAVVSMYHDQGLIPLKLLHFEDAVNVTLGLPIVRTSVDHGTAYELAGTGRANPASMINALRLAARMAENRGRRTGTRDERSACRD